MAQTFFNHFRCRRLSSELRVLDSDYSIECVPDDKGSQWWILATFSAMGVIFVVGFPIGTSHANADIAGGLTVTAS